MFSEAKYYAAFKKVRNQFRKYRYDELIKFAFEYINAPTKDKLESIRRYPWLIVLFVKWVLLDEQYPNKIGMSPSKSDAISLFQLVMELSDKLRMPDDYDHHILFFRNFAYQQFIFQIDFSYAHISRQSLIFSTLDNNHFIKKEFRNKTGLEIQDYLDLSFFTTFTFLDSNNTTTLQYNYFSPIYSKYPREKVLSFINLISKELNVFRRQLIDEDNRKRLAVEHYQPTPFLDCPFIATRGQLLLTHKNILFRHFDYFIYDTVRKIDSNKFMSKFGKLFESYIEKSIIYSGVDHLTEKDIIKSLGSSGNQIDFIIQDETANIFIDAKASEMSSAGKNTHSSYVLSSNTKISILKAIEQSHDVMKKITMSKGKAISGHTNNYLLVITYKELYLGNGTTYYEAIAKNKMDDIYAKYEERIPPENMYFMTIHEFDILTDLLKKKILTLTEILEKAKANDAKPETKKFDFLQHLKTMGVPLQFPEPLALEKDKMFDRLSQAL